MVHDIRLHEHTVVFSKNAEKFLDTLDHEPKLRIFKKYES